MEIKLEDFEWYRQLKYKLADIGVYVFKDLINKLETSDDFIKEMPPYSPLKPLKNIISDLAQLELTNQISTKINYSYYLTNYYFTTNTKKRFSKLINEENNIILSSKDEIKTSEITSDKFRKIFTDLKDNPHIIKKYNEITGLYIPLDVIFNDYKYAYYKLGNEVADKLIINTIKQKISLFKVEFDSQFKEFLTKEILKHLENKYENLIPKEQLKKALE